MYGPSKASYGYTVRGWGLQGVYKGLQGVYKGYLDYLRLKLLLMLCISRVSPDVAARRANSPTLRVRKV